jgi:hypothetical protein
LVFNALFVGLFGYYLYKVEVANKCYAIDGVKNPVLSTDAGAVDVS